MWNGVFQGFSSTDLLLNANDKGERNKKIGRE
jgi:hypothetical protein